MGLPSLIYGILSIQNPDFVTSEDEVGVAAKVLENMLQELPFSLLFLLINVRYWIEL